MFVLHGLLPGHQLPAYRILFQDIACRHLFWRRLRPVAASCCFFAPDYQPIADVNQDSNNNYP